MATPPSPEEASVAVPAMVGFVGAGIGALGFGAGYGARSYYTTAAYKELLEKFPEAPGVEAEALARTGATRAFLGGTALCGLMGVGAVMTARAYGIRSAAELGDEIKKWLPTQASLEAAVVPKLAPLQRTITEHMQGARDAASGTFQKSELGRKLSERAQSSLKEQKIEPWEKEVIATLEGKPAPPK